MLNRRGGDFRTTGKMTVLIVSCKKYLNNINKQKGE